MIPYLLKKQTNKKKTKHPDTYTVDPWTMGLNCTCYLQELFHKIITTTLHNLWLLESRNGKSGNGGAACLVAEHKLYLDFQYRGLVFLTPILFNGQMYVKNIWMLTVWNHRWVNTLRTLFLYLRGEKGTFFKVLLLPRLQLLFWNFC